MAAEIVGRNDEVAALDAFFGTAGAGPGALVLEGEAGIGKTTLWLAGVEEARRRGLRVLVARPDQAEQDLAHVALGDLFDSQLGDVLPELPTPRRRALETALLLDSGDGRRGDVRTLGVAVLSAIRLLAERGAMVVAVDDVQWLDASSEAALAFALRRLETEPVLALLARRAEPGSEPTELEAALPARARLQVGPLSIGALQRLVRTRFDRALPRPTILRLRETSAGNPFYALELAQAIVAVEPPFDPAAPFPFPDSLQALVAGRLAGLPDETRSALLVVAALGSPTPAEVDGAGVPAAALDPAIAAGVLERDSELRFTHPLLASELESAASPDERRAVHRRLIAVARDPIGRAHNLALALDGPDEGAAATLEAAAGLARARGAPSVAAELLEAAVRATPAAAADDRHRRLIQAALERLASGTAERAFSIARDALVEASSARAHAEAHMVLGELEDTAGSSVVALGHYREALASAAGVPELELRIHEGLALNVRITGDLAVAEEHARAAVALGERLDDDALLARAVSALAVVRCNRGGTDTWELAERALELALRSGDRETIDEARIGYGHCHIWTCRLDDARPVLLETRASAAEYDEPCLSNAFWYLALLEERAGRLALAREHAEQSYDVAAQYAGPGREHEPSVVGVLARVAAVQGEDGFARELIALGLAHPDAARRTSTTRHLHGVLATLDHWAGNSAGAAERFDVLDEERRRFGFSFRMATTAGDHCEALLTVGRLDDARELLDRWEAEIAAIGHDWGLAEVVRSRGLLAAAEGNADLATDLLDRAVAAHEAVGDPLGRGRAWLALGVARRRLRQKRAARDAFDAALAQFEDMGAAGWAARVRGEVGRVGGRTRVEGLTPAEQRVAELVAEGRTNKEVAAALFLGERTVETHLTHIYAKLGVRSRAQLTRALR